MVEEYMKLPYTIELVQEDDGMDIPMPAVSNKKRAKVAQREKKNAK